MTLAVMCIYFFILNVLKILSLNFVKLEKKNPHCALILMKNINLLSIHFPVRLQ